MDLRACQCQACAQRRGGAVVVSHAVSITTIRTWIQGEALGMCIRLPGCAACVAFDTVDHHMKRGRA
ncbi:hypothetical protein WJ45_01675 [Burkholderia ubonensis]|nr:hypothetical protein WJ45_01675 [Burkholderia ubonensis]KVN75734.1 hypothetical protein WJ67_16830 [Burkholderia ubonensis]KVQ50377.1 hypothetical protein WK04_05925 [Burkholderia ubonensis]